MNTKNAKIEIPKGYEIDSVDNRSGEVKFKKKPENVMAKIETVTDVLEANGLTQEQFDHQCEGFSDDEKAYRILKLLAKALNEGWEPNWNDDNETKYFPWFEMGGSRGFRAGDFVVWNSGSAVGSRLAFKSYELAKYAGEQFTNVYKQFMTI